MKEKLLMMKAEKIVDEYRRINSKPKMFCSIECFVD